MAPWNGPKISEVTSAEHINGRAGMLGELNKRSANTAPLHSPSSVSRYAVNVLMWERPRENAWLSVWCVADDEASTAKATVSKSACK